MFFNITCYIEKITETQLKVRIVDADNLLKFQKNINGLYKTKKGTDTTHKHNTEQDMFNLKINKKTKFDLIGVDYSNLNNLVGTSIRISGESKYYCFFIKDEFTDEKKYINGYSLVCNKIYR